MLLDPFGEIITECRDLDDQSVSALLTADKLTMAGGYRYRKARKTELYADIIGAPHSSELKVVWMNKDG